MLHCQYDYINVVDQWYVVLNILTLITHIPGQRILIICNVINCKYFANKQFLIFFIKILMLYYMGPNINLQLANNVIITEDLGLGI